MCASVWTRHHRHRLQSGVCAEILVPEAVVPVDVLLRRIACHCATFGRALHRFVVCWRMTLGTLRVVVQAKWGGTGLRLYD